MNMAKNVHNQYRYVLLYQYPNFDTKLGYICFCYNLVFLWGFCKYETKGWIFQ